MNNALLDLYHFAASHKGALGTKSSENGVEIGDIKECNIVINVVF